MTFGVLIGTSLSHRDGVPMAAQGVRHELFKSFIEV